MCQTVRQTDLRVMLAGPKGREVGESGKLDTGNAYLLLEEGRGAPGMLLGGLGFHALGNETGAVVACLCCVCSVGTPRDGHARRRCPRNTRESVAISHGS
eukprot:1192379-Prorocentrum_minimum.AAC.3